MFTCLICDKCLLLYRHSLVVWLDLLDKGKGKGVGFGLGLGLGLRPRDSSIK